MSITFSAAIEKYTHSKRAKGFSENTISAYSNTFHQFNDFLGADPDVDSIISDQIIEFLASCNHVSKKTKLNHHTGLSSLWTFLVSRELASKHILKEVERPDPETREINPFSQHDVQELLKAAEIGQTPIRNRTMIMLLLDTGVRASELCAIKLRDIDFANRRIRIFGKGSKERLVPFSSITKDVINFYLQGRNVNLVKDRSASLFVSQVGGSFDRNGLSQILEKIAARANIYPCNPHRYRHTFAIQFLRNGGSIYTLQKILGHTTLDMVKKYLAIAQCDLDRDHEIASPVKRWGFEALPQQRSHT